VVLGRFDLEALLAAIQRYRCTLTTLIATINVAIVSHPRTKHADLSSMRACFSGGAPVPEEVARRWEETTGYKLIEGYGLSETTATSHLNPPHRPKYGTGGSRQPLPRPSPKTASSAAVT
jgi:acyl-CoA synthetase (AMP-forming)/AMP-acid ligase II